MNFIEQELSKVVAWIQAEAKSALSILVSFFKEAITEEEAALFPQFQALATQVLNDEAKILGLNVSQRVAVIVADFSAQLPQDIAIARNALLNSWAWAIAHQTGQKNGNQGVSSNADFSGNANSAPTTTTP